MLNRCDGGDASRLPAFVPALLKTTTHQEMCTGHINSGRYSAANRSDVNNKMGGSVQKETTTYGNGFLNNSHS